jgi:hypothetical protein
VVAVHRQEHLLQEVLREAQPDEEGEQGGH